MSRIYGKINLDEIEFRDIVVVEGDHPMSYQMKHRLGFIVVFAIIFTLIIRRPKQCLIAFAVICFVGAIVDACDPDHNSVATSSYSSTSPHPTASTVFVDSVSDVHRSSYNYPGPFPDNIVTATIRNTSGHKVKELWLGCRVTDRLYDPGNPNLYEGTREYAVVMNAIPFFNNPTANRPAPNGQPTLIDFDTREATSNAYTGAFSAGVDESSSFSDCVAAFTPDNARNMITERMGAVAAKGRWIERTANLPQGY